MVYLRTFKTDKLYHQFLAPQRISIDQLPFLVTKLYEAGFIELYHQDDGSERYSELNKLLNNNFKTELFKIIGELK
jgi:hypothetical protein